MSKEWEEYKKAKAESDRVTNQVLHEIDRNRLGMSSGGESGGGGGCFPGDVRVLTPWGTKELVSLKTGDLVLSYSKRRSASCLLPRKVTRHLKHPAQHIEIVHYNAGQPLRTTRNHTLLSTRGWLRVDNLKVGDDVVQSDGSTRRVTKRECNAPELVYNLHTAGEHNFIVDGCVVHNFSWFRRLRTTFHVLFVDSYTQTESFEALQTF